jgi:hypothetical protein
LKIISMTERIEIQYMDDIEQRLCEEEMVGNGWRIVRHNTESPNIVPSTIYEKKVYNEPVVRF